MSCTYIATVSTWNPSGDTAWESGRQFSLFQLFTFTFLNYIPQPCKILFAGVSTSILPPVPVDSVKPLILLPHFTVFQPWKPRNSKVLLTGAPPHISTFFTGDCNSWFKSRVPLPFSYLSIEIMLCLPETYLQVHPTTPQMLYGSHI